MAEFTTLMYWPSLKNCRRMVPIVAWPNRRNAGHASAGRGLAGTRCFVTAVTHRSVPTGQIQHHRHMALTGSTQVSQPWTPEEAVLQVVTRRVLTPDFVSALVAEVSGLMNRHVPTVQGQMDEARRQLAGIDDAISNLLDLAERFGAASAGPRLVEREAERALLQARLEQLALQQEAHQATISLEMMCGMLTEMHGTLTDGNIGAKRALLSKVVHKVVMGATGAELLYTFPLGE